MTLNLDPLKNLLTASNIGKLIALIIAAFGLPGLATTAPQAMSGNGVPVDDLVSTLTPFAAAVATWLGAGWLKATPELVLSAVGLMKSPKDPDAQARFEIACLRMLGAQHEGQLAVQAAISNLAKALSEARFPPPAAAMIYRDIGNATLTKEATEALKQYYKSNPKQPNIIQPIPAELFSDPSSFSSFNQVPAAAPATTEGRVHS